ncbi:MAG: ABC transporter permease [Candidatus Adiutrix sp.]|jgi:putative ABC transport system permease protein|nr:ABC transporter permease [Candidatus Adiutrix sp.]
MTERAFTPGVLARANLRRRPFRSAGLAGLVALFTFVLFGGTILNENLSRGLDSLAGRLGADLLIVPYGYEKETQAALLRGEPSTFYLKADLLDKVRGAPGVVQASPQFFLASLNASCCTAQVQIIGYDPESDFLIRPWTRGNLAALEKGQVVVGSRIIPAVGEELTLFGVGFAVAAKMEATGMGFDTSVFMSLDDVYELMVKGGLAEGDLSQINAFISSIALKTSPDFAPRDVGNELMRRHALDYNLDLVLTKNLLSDISVSLKNFSSFIWVLAAFLWLLAMIVMSVVFSVALNERQREFSLLRILGATRGWLGRLILHEASYIGFGGAALGLAGAAVIIFPFSTLIFQSIGLPHLRLSGLTVLAYGLAAFILAGAAGPLASLYSVLSITRFDIYPTLREGE